MLSLGCQKHTGYWHLRPMSEKAFGSGRPWFPERKEEGAHREMKRINPLAGKGNTAFTVCAARRPAAIFKPPFIGQSLKRGGSDYSP